MSRQEVIRDMKYAGDVFDCGCYGLCEECREKSTRRDVRTAIELQEWQEYGTELDLIEALERRHGWNSLYAEKIAGLAWVELYAEKDEEHEKEGDEIK